MTVDESELADWIASLPKAELHVHLVGSASVPTVLELARRHPDAGVPTEEGALRSFYAFTSFAHFIDLHRRQCTGTDRGRPRGVGHGRAFGPGRSAGALRRADSHP